MNTIVVGLPLASVLQLQDALTLSAPVLDPCSASPAFV